MENLFKTALKRSLAFSLAFISALCVFGQVSYHTPFHHTLLHKTDTIAPNNVTYKYVELDADCDGYTNEPGYPMLPVKYVTLSVPYNAYNFSISYGTVRKTTHTLDKKVYPCQAPTKIGDPIVFTTPNDSVYALNQYIHSDVAEIVSEGYIEGENHVVTLAIYPIAYNPTENKYWFRFTVNLSLNYSITTDISSSSSPLTYKPLLRYSSSNAAPSRVHTQSLVVNPSQVGNFAIQNAIRPQVDPTVTHIAPVGYEYVVVTCDSLATSFDRLIALKRQKGINAGVVTMEQIYSDPLYTNGDVISGINDNAGKLRAYLTEAFGHGLRFVFLAGSRNIVPIRYASPTATNDSTKMVPTDMYFSSLNCNWDKNGNGIYGETNRYTGDSISYDPTVFVGRLLCYNKEDVNNYVNKVIRYELYPGNGDTSYLTKGFLSQTDGMKGVHEADKVALAWDDVLDCTIINSAFDTSIGYYYPTGAQVIGMLNSTKYGFVSLHGHGNPGGITVFSNINYPNNPQLIYGVTALDDPNESWYHTDEVGNGLDCLTNKDYPMVWYSMSCDNMPYDILGTYTVKKNFGESLTNGHNYGAVAFLGNTRVGYVGSSAQMETKFVKAVINRCQKVGIAEAESRMTRNTSTPWLQLTHNLLGDPEFEMWTDIPTTFSGISVERMNNSINAYGFSNDSTFVAVSNPSLAINDTIIAGTTTFSNVSPNSCVMIYRHNAIPYIAPLLLQNDTVQYKYYYIVNTASLGANIDSNRSAGNYVLDNGANLTIEAFGDVELHPGFIMNSGSSLKIITDGEVKIFGGALNSGSYLEIRAKKVNFVGRFDAARGSIIKIVKNVH